MGRLGFGDMQGPGFSRSMGAANLKGGSCDIRRDHYLGGRFLVSTSAATAQGSTTFQTGREDPVGNRERKILYIVVGFLLSLVVGLVAGIVTCSMGAAPLDGMSNGAVGFGVSMTLSLGVMTALGVFSSSAPLN